MTTSRRLGLPPASPGQQPNPGLRRCGKGARRILAAAGARAAHRQKGAPGAGGCEERPPLRVACLGGPTAQPPEPRPCPAAARPTAQTSRRMKGHHFSPGLVGRRKQRQWPPGGENSCSRPLGEGNFHLLKLKPIPQRAPIWERPADCSFAGSGSRVKVVWCSGRIVRSRPRELRHGFPRD